MTDLTGLLAAPGQLVQAGDAADSRKVRLSVVVDALWRAEALAEMIAEAGLGPEITHTDEKTPLVRTEADVRLSRMAQDWTRGAVKTVPDGWLPGPRVSNYFR